MKIHPQPVLPPPPPPPPVRTSSTATVTAPTNLWVPVSPAGAVTSKSRPGASGTGVGGQRASSSSTSAASTTTGTVSKNLTIDPSVPYTRGSLVDILT
jgi:hypothetical protein